MLLNYKFPREYEIYRKNLDIDKSENCGFLYCVQGPYLNIQELIFRIVWTNY